MTNTGIDPGLKTTSIITLDTEAKIKHRYSFGSDINHKFQKAVQAHPADRWHLYYTEFGNHFDKYQITGTVVIERPAGQLLGNSRKLLNVEGIFLLALAQRIPSRKIFIVSPTAIKKFFTKSGAASKQDMLDSARFYGYSVDTHHEADSLAAALMGHEGKLNV